MALRKLIFRKNYEPVALDIINNSVASNADHNLFKPILGTPFPRGGNMVYPYTYASGPQSFEVEVNPSGFPAKATGDNLFIHNFGRGNTQDPDKGSKQPGMDSTHLIANLFGGSGYTKGKNLVLASTYYNQTLMAAKECSIAKHIIDFLPKHPRPTISNWK